VASAGELELPFPAFLYRSLWMYIRPLMFVIDLTRKALTRNHKKESTEITQSKERRRDASEVSAVTVPHPQQFAEAKTQPCGHSAVTFSSPRLADRTKL
jgi:hypothetical protein